jgi:hypothetical protein
LIDCECDAEQVSSTDNIVNVEIHSRERPRGVFGGLDSEANTTTPSVTTYSWNKDTGCGEWNYVYEIIS